jgi:UDP-N-acetylmuramoyl-tripeptide--D-alanyl-D-alanine ligase
MSVFRAAKKRIKSPTDVDIIVQELGTDRIGQIPRFGKYLHPDIAIVTAVSPEHMEYFKTMDNVAAEELSVVNYSKQAVINRDDIDGEYVKFVNNQSISTYGTKPPAEYHFISGDYIVGEGHKGFLAMPESPEKIEVILNVIGEHSQRPAVAAAAVAAKLGMNTAEISSGLAKVQALPGRMNVLRGVKDSMIIDDSYNSSPLAVASALRELYKISAPQKIAVLGSMNELGEMSASEHKKLGELCDPSQLAWVVTVGDEAEKYTAPAARAKGCQVKSFHDAISAGGFVNGVLDTNAAILFKGSEGKIYLEEAIKVILHSSEEQESLVRQSPDWLKRKSAFFEKDFK